MKQDRLSTRLSDDDVETLDIPDGVELDEIKADDDESRTDDSSTHLAARLRYAAKAERNNHRACQ